MMSCTPSIHDGYKALSIYDYFKAKKIFYKHYRSKKVNVLTGAESGLSQIYGRPDNPFFNLDSALKFSRLAHEHYEQIPKKQSSLFYKTNITNHYLDSIRVNIDAQIDLNFPLKIKSDSIGLEMQEDFIYKYYDHEKIDFYKNKRDTTAFNIAKSHGAIGMYNFLKSYPKSTLTKNAERLRDEFIFKSSIEQNDFESFDRFIQLHQQNEFKSAAIDSLYTLTFKYENLEWLGRLLQSYPSEIYASKSLDLYLYKHYAENKSKPALPSIEYFNENLQNKIRLLNSYPTRPFLIFNKDEEPVYFIGEDGNKIIETGFQEAQMPINGISIVSKNNTSNLSSIEGKSLLVGTYDDLENIFPYHYIFLKNGKYGLLNALGHILINPIYDELSYDKNQQVLIALKNKKFGLITCFNNIILPFDFDNISDIKNGICIVKKNEQLSFYRINSKKFDVLPYNWADNSHAKWIRVKKESLYGIINYKNEIIIDCHFDRIKILNDSIFLVVKDASYGILNSNNAVIVPVENTYDELIEKELLLTKNYRKVVSILGEGIINNYNQDIIAKKKKQHLQLVNNQFAVIEKNNAFFLFDLQKKQIVASYKTEPSIISEQLILVNENKKDYAYNLVNKKRVLCSAINKFNKYYLLKLKDAFQIVDESLNPMLSKDVAEYEKIDDIYYKLLIENEWYLYDTNKNDLIKVK
jgi:hypothetical protein